MNSSDLELLELAAKAAGLPLLYPERDEDPFLSAYNREWNPLADDGDALRLAVKLDMIVTVNRVDERTDVSAGCSNNDLVRIVEPHAKDLYAATRRAIVRSAAEIGRIG